MSNEHTESIDWARKSILITGGTGSFGKKIVEIMLREFHPKRLIVFSRDELKQHDMRQNFPDDPLHNTTPMRYFIGDVRDLDRLRRAMNSVDIVVHAAALKQVPTCEYNPIEAVMTNVMGAKNVIEAALDMKVSQVMALSTDKAVSPVNLYGATKLVAEKLFIQANSYSGAGPTRFSVVRYGNILGSRGSVIPLFLKQRETSKITLTDPRMTRFWLTLDQGVRFVINCITKMRGGEVFVPKIPSMSILELAESLAPQCEHEYVGIRPGEKLHETLISEDEARNAFDLENMFILKPSSVCFYDDYCLKEGHLLQDGFKYTSDTNNQWLSPERLLELVDELPILPRRWAPKTRQQATSANDTTPSSGPRSRWRA